jgi:tRNA(Ile2) C34 agmatinyltransferase TiaS
MSFKLLRDPDNTVYRVFVIASQAYTIGDLVDISRTAADVVPSTSASVTYGVRGVAMQTVTSAATTLLVALVTPRQDWVATVTNASNVAHSGQRMVLTDARTVNNTGTDSTTSAGVFEQSGAVDATHVVGRILQAANITA